MPPFCHRRLFFGTPCVCIRVYVCVCNKMSLRTCKCVYSKSVFQAFRHIASHPLFLDVATGISAKRLYAHIVCTCTCIWANLFYAYRIFSSIVQMDFFYFHFWSERANALSLSLHFVLTAVPTIQTQFTQNADNKICSGDFSRYHRFKSAALVFTAHVVEQKVGKILLYTPYEQTDRQTNWHTISTK